MGRPPLPAGTYGEITTRRLPSGGWEARTQWRGVDGKKRRPACRGATKTAAENNLRKKLKEWATEADRGEISSETIFGEVAELCLAEVQREADKGIRSPQTPRLYRGWLNNHILPALGALRCREMEGKITRVDAVIQGVHDRHSYDSAKTVRTVLSLVCGYAVRHGAMKQNPIRSAARLARAPGEQKVVVALTDGQRGDVLDRLEEYTGQKERDSKGRRLGKRALVWRDLSELAEVMLATGARIGEVLALSKDSVTKLDDGRTAVDVDHHIVRVPGEGLVRLPGRKGGAPGLTLIVPSWAAAIFTRRKLAANTDGPLFASVTGTWLDPSNSGGRLHDALKDTDLEWVTPHVFRKTVGSDIDEAGLTLSEGADQLGNSPEVFNRHYRMRRSTNQRAADVLDRKAPRRRKGSA